MPKINILFVNYDQAGVNYHRTLNPALALQRNYPDRFHVEINPKVDWNDTAYLKNFQLVHYHTTLGNAPQQEAIHKMLRSLGIRVILDIDDHWNLPPGHPLYRSGKDAGLAASVLANIRLADHVTTSTSFLASEVGRINKSVTVLANAIHPADDQWNRPRTESDRATLGVLCGSSHYHDLKLLEGVNNYLQANQALKNKFQWFLCGYDLRGEITDRQFNPDLLQFLQQTGLWDKRMSDELKKSGFRIAGISRIPKEIRDAYAGQELVESKRNIEPKESVWYLYEQILLGNDFQYLGNPEYAAWLHTFKEGEHPAAAGSIYRRVWTRPVNQYAKGYANFRTGIVPLTQVHHPFIRSKSNLKLIENGFHRNAVIVSQSDCYAEIEHGKNGLVIRTGREHDWAKTIRMVVQNPSMASDLGEALYETVRDKYDINKSVGTRAHLYESLAG